MGVNASEDDAAPENSEHAPEDQQAGGGVGEHAQTAGEKAADAVDAGVDIAAGAAQGAKVGGAWGAVAGGALAAAKNEKSRRWLLWLIVLVLAPSLLIGGLATAALLSMSLSVTNDIDATGAAGESGVASDRVNLHVDAAANTQVPWYVLTAVDQAAPGGSFGLDDAPDDEFAAAKEAAALLEDRFPEAFDRHPGELYWRLLAGVSTDRSGNAFVDQADPRAVEDHTRNLEAWQQALAELPGIGTQAPATAMYAFLLATGQRADGCGIGTGTVAGSITVSDGTWVSPVEGRVSSQFGMRVHPTTGEYKLHTGADVSAPKGTPIWAASAGTVTYAGGHPSCSDSACGAVIEIDHGNGVLTRYLHMNYSDHMVAVGDSVAGGQQIGKVNTAGRSTEPHLHFEVLAAGEFVDPVKFLADRGATYGTATPAPTAPPPGALATSLTIGRARYWPPTAAPSPSPRSCRPT